MSARYHVYFIEKPSDRWIPGDHKWRGPLRQMLRGPDPVGGVKRVYLNLVRGLERLGADVRTNRPFSEIGPGDRVGVVGRGVDCLSGYRQRNPVVTGVAVVEHPAQWRTLFDDLPVACNIVHSDWVKAMYARHYGEARLRTWAVGIDTDVWTPAPAERKSVDFLLYDKVMWDHDRVHAALVDPVKHTLRKRGLSFDTIRYGAYRPQAYRAALAQARFLLFLCEHETQGLAYQEAMSCGLPVLAWDPGRWLDPWRHRYGEDAVPATSVPFFDERCGRTFRSAVDFEAELDFFLETARQGRLAPRDYVLEHLQLEDCARRYLEILDQSAS